ncbi:MAG: hypothetical protein NTU41_12030, partial [Chloroflexi bacterium]|nr:hypothetical protein [Chloroflexota bacterium]
LTSRLDMAAEISIPSRWRLLNSLQTEGVTALTGLKIESIARNGVAIVTATGESKTVEGDTVIFAEGIEPNPKLFQALEGRIPGLYRAGDCKGLGLIRGAIADGAEIAAHI